jgi:hypothetical protein
VSREHLEILIVKEAVAFSRGKSGAAAGRRVLSRQRRVRSSALLPFTTRLPILPRGRITMQINDRKDEDFRSIDPVEHAVGEPAWDSSPHLSVDDLVLHRVEATAIEKTVDLLHECAAEADALAFIPSGGLR